MCLFIKFFHTFSSELRVLYGKLIISSNNFTKIKLPKLQVIYADFEKRDCFHDNKNNITYPCAVITIESNPNLKSLEFPNLREVYKGMALLTNNPKLCTDKINFHELGFKKKYGGVIDCDKKYTSTGIAKSDEKMKIWHNGICENANSPVLDKNCDFKCPHTIYTNLPSIEITSTNTTLTNTTSTKTTSTYQIQKPTCRKTFSTISNQHSATQLPETRYCFSAETCQSPSFRKPCDFCKDLEDKSHLVGCVPGEYKTLRDVECCHTG